MHPDDDPLSRFVAAQASAHATALDEIRQGHKRTHWIWYVFPQLRGLGTSAASVHYGIAGVGEARAYLAHPLLGARLHEAIDAMLRHPSADAAAVLGGLDAMKFRSCLTLFARAAPDPAPFDTALARFFDGVPDPRTLALLDTASPTPGPNAAP